MDNLTHTLIGVLVGEAAAHRSHRSVGSSDGLTRSARRAAIVMTMAIGSNLPDLDFVYSTVTGSKLDYLLHHRGHTHTMLGALGIAALTLVAIELWIRIRRWRPSRADRIWIVSMTALAPILHIAMDMTNSYGVHPWWPLDNEWIYGDSVFIVEPLLWAAAAPLVFSLHTLIARSLVGLALVAGVVLTFVTGMVPPSLAVAYTALVAAMLLLAWKLAPERSIASGIALWLVVTFGFAATGHLVDRRIESLVAATFPESEVLDRILMPMPVNPLCWELILVQRETNELVLRRGMYATLPVWMPADRCPGRGLEIAVTAPLQEVARADTPAVRWHGEVRTSIAALALLWETNCRVDAFMRFARAPWLAEVNGEQVVGDLRYDREAELSFAEIEIELPQEPCRRYVPPWTPPRADLKENY